MGPECPPEARAADIAQATIGWDLEKDIHSRAEGSPAQTFGLSAAVIGARYSVGLLHDPDGFGDEVHQALAYEFNARQWRRVFKRFSTGDFAASPASLDAGLPRLRVYAPNLRFTVGRKWISTDSETSARDGRDSWYFSVAL